MQYRVRRLHERAILPTRHNPRDAGLDLYAISDVAIPPGELQTIPTGIAIQPASTSDGPHAIAGLVWDKSCRASIGLKTMGGVIDESYTGELLIVVTNLNTGPVLAALASRDAEAVERAIAEATIRIPYGKAIAQLLVQAVDLVEPIEVDLLDETDRGANGFGSSDRH